MRKLTVLLALIALAAFVMPASAQLWIGMGRYTIDDSTDGDPADNMFRVGQASVTAGATGAATWVSGSMAIATGNQVQIGKGTIDAVNLTILRGWGSVAMVDGNLDLSTIGATAQVGVGNGTGYITQIGGTLTLKAVGKEVMFGAPSTSGGFPKKTEGLGDAYVELKGGVMNAFGAVRFGAYNYWKDANAFAMADDPSGACIGRLTVTGNATFNNLSPEATDNLFVGFTGGDGKVQFLGTSVDTLGFVQVGNADMRTYIKDSDSSTGTIWRYGKAVLKIGKDATVTATSFNLYDNPNSELSIEIASLTDFSSMACSGIATIGATWSTDVPANMGPGKLSIDLQGYDPLAMDEWVIVTGSSVLRTDEFQVIVADAPLSDPTWSWRTRVDDGNKLVLYVFPEPATLALLSLGGLALIRRRR